MNIFKKIKLANRLINTINEIKRYFDSNHIPTEVKSVVDALKNDLKKLGALIPALEQSVKDVLEILK